MQGVRGFFLCLLTYISHRLANLQLACFGVPQGSVRIWQQGEREACKVRP